jgi:hypothetical protein
MKGRISFEIASRLIREMLQATKRQAPEGASSGDVHVNDHDDTKVQRVDAQAKRQRV